MSVLYQRFCHWMHTSAIFWRRPRTMVATVRSGQRTSRRWLFLLAILGTSGGVVQWQVRADHARPLELGLSVPEQAFADAVTTSPARTEPEAEARNRVFDPAPATSTVPSSDFAAQVAVPALSVTESAAPHVTPEACVSTPQRPAASDLRSDATTAPPLALPTSAARRRPAARLHSSPHRVIRLAPPRGIAVVAVASRSALLRLSHGPLVTVQSGTVLQGWTVQRFSPSGITFAHHDQHMLVPITLETIGGR